MGDPMHDLAKTVFKQAKAAGQWDAHAFAPWLRNASTHDWNQLEVAWQYEDCPQSFSWPVLKSAVEDSAQAFTAPPLATLGAFLFPPGARLGYEGYWLDWQTDDVKQDVYQTAQHWMEQSTWGLDDQAWILLHLAVSTDNMPMWRRAPDKCVAELDWAKGMFGLNACSPDTLTIADIERVPFNNVAPSKDPFHKTLIGTMLQSCTLNWRTLARCIENKAGPGMWLQYVLSAQPNATEGRRMTAWNNMLLDGVDAWAMIQFYRPAPTFEESFEGMRGFQPVAPYKEWAHQWWIQCVLGMDRALALDLARNVRTPMRPTDVFDIDPGVFGDSQLVLG